MKQSESLHNLISSSSINNKIELCEVFVIIGASDESLSKSLFLSLNLSKDKHYQMFILVSNLHNRKISPFRMSTY